jgi:hypothetical protein
MLQTKLKDYKEKSLQERFLFVIALLVLVAYLILGLTFIFWRSMPIAMEYSYRIAFGIVLIAYSCIRFYRLFSTNND